MSALAELVHAQVHAGDTLRHLACPDRPPRRALCGWVCRRPSPPPGAELCLVCKVLGERPCPDCGQEHIVP